MASQQIAKVYLRGIPEPFTVTAGDGDRLAKAAATAAGERPGETRSAPFVSVPIAHDAGSRVAAGDAESVDIRIADVVAVVKHSPAPSFVPVPGTVLR